MKHRHHLQNPLVSSNCFASSSTTPTFPETRSARAGTSVKRTKREKKNLTLKVIACNDGKRGVVTIARMCGCSRSMVDRILRDYALSVDAG
jgi:hypothetical protein